MLRKLLVVGGLVVFVIFAIIAANSYTKTHTPTRGLSQKFIGYVLKEDASASYALFSNTAKDSQSQNSWSRTVSDIAPFFKGKQPVFVSTDTTATTGQTILTYDITGVDNRDYNFVLSLTEENKQWRVASFVSKLASTNDSKNGSLAN